MKIVRLESENIKRLKAVSITPAGNLVEITGRNGAGKTSILDSIYWALAGTSHVQSVPIRKGETEATIKLDLGELKVRRSFKKKDGGEYTTSIVVESADGMRATSPQKMLDALVGELSFDPLAFTRLGAKGQFETLKRFVPGVDFEAIERANKADYDRRTDVNRRAKEARASAEQIIVVEPRTEVDESALVGELKAAGQHNAKLEREKAIRQDAGDVIERRIANEAETRQRAASLREEAASLEEQAERLKTGTAARIADFEGLPALGDPIDTGELREKIAAARRYNSAIDVEAADRNRRAEQIARADQLDKDSKALTAAIEKRTKDKQIAIANAQMPVDGVEFGDGEILLNGVPFDQASDAEQLRASIAIAAAGNPKLRVIRVRDGSLLDAGSMTLLAELAAERDMQVWVETVSSGRPGAIVIEDGALAQHAIAAE